MVRKRLTKLADIVYAAEGRGARPHLFPINAAAFEGDHDVAMAKIDRLASYRRYLIDARATKARRKRVSSTFERNVQEQARQAAKDLQVFSGATLRTVRQMNQTEVW
jgi:hypothetical protein